MGNAPAVTHPLLALLAIVSIITPATAAVFTVSNDIELTAAINAANANIDTDVIELADDIELTVVDNIGNGPNGLPIINTPIVILGHQFSLSRHTAAPLFRMFEVRGSFFGDGELTLDGIKLEGGDASPGAGGIPSNPCFADLDLCGGAVLTLFGKVTLRGGTTMENNRAFMGGAIFSASADVRIEDSLFAENAGTYGGAISSQLSSTGAITIQRSTFSANQAERGGGAIYNRGNLVVSDSDFTGNRTTAGSTTFDGGGAIHNNSITAQADIANSSFTDNEANNGGAILNFNAADIIIRNSDIIDNRTIGFGNGGGVYNDGSGAAATITDSRITDNNSTTAFGKGGGIYSPTGGILTLENSEVLRNTSSGDGGGAVASRGRIVNSKIELNVTTSGDGGGIYHEGLRGLEIIASSISNNSARFEGGGLATFVGNSFPPDGISISDSTISGNTSKGSGGGIANREQGKVTIARSLIADNACTTIFCFAGGVFSNNTFTLTTVTDSTIANNSSATGAGGLYNNNASIMVINHSTITGNMSGSQTGGIGQLSGTLEISDTILANNSGSVDSPNCLFLGSVTDSGGNFTNARGTNFPCPATFTETTGLNLDSLADNGGSTLTQALLPGSVAINGGVVCGTATDQRGIPRAAACDAGAYEGDAIVPLLSFETAVSATDESPGGIHQVFVELDNTAGDIATGRVELYVALQGSAARGGRDYSLVNTPPIVFSNGSWPDPGTATRQAIDLDILPDFVLEGDQSVLLKLTNSGFSGPASITAADQHTVTIVDALADLEIEKSVDATGTLLPGDGVTYTIQVSNLGPTDAANVSVYDLMDNLALDLAAAHVTPTIGVFNPATGDWSLDGALQGNGFDLPAGSTETLTVRAEVTAQLIGTVDNTAEISRFFPAQAADPDSGNDTSSAAFDVCDAIQPTLSVELSHQLLWPPNHHYVNVAATVIAEDSSGAAPTISLLSATSNEADNGRADGNTINDIVVLDDRTFQLRAERSGRGTGREYTISYQATDQCGNSAIESAVVVVPRNMGR